MRIPNSLKFLALSAIIAVPAVSSAQTTVYSNVVGFDTITCSTGTTGGVGSDSMVSASLHQCAEFVGSVGSVTGTAITPSATVAWGVNDFASGGLLTHYVRMTSGSLLGHYFDVVSNAAGSISIDTSGLPMPAVGDSFKVVPFWTLDSLFPAATQSTFIVSPGTLGFQKRSALFIPDVLSPGINLPYSTEYIITPTGWKRIASGFPAAGTDVIRPDVPFIVRHPNPASAGVASTNYVISGEVSYDAAAVNAATRTGSFRQDTAVAFQRPVDVELQDLGFTSADFVASSGTLGFQRRDTLLVFDYSQTGINRPANREYYMVGSNWIRVDSGNPVANTDVINSSTGLVIRKYQTTSGATSTTINNPAY